MSEPSLPSPSVDEAVPPLPPDTGASADTAAWWEDYVDIFYAPSRVFRRRAEQGFGAPFVIVSLLAAILGFATFNALLPLAEGDIARAAALQMQKNPQLKPEQVTAMRPIMITVARLGIIVGTPIAIFITGLLLWLTGKALGARQSVNAALLVASFAFLPRALAFAVAGAEALLIDTSTRSSMFQLSLGPSRFLDPDTTPPGVVALLARMDVFTIWVTVLLAIGLRVTGKVSAGRAAAAGVILWILGGAPTILQLLR